MWLRTSCDFSFDVAAAVPFVLMLRPRSGAHQWIALEEYRLEPSVPVFEFTDDYCNLCQRLVAPAGRFGVRTKAEVMTSELIDQGYGAPFIEIQSLPNAVLSYLLPSRYCESDRFHGLASDIAAGQLPGYDQVAAICRWLRDAIQFSPGSSNCPLSAVEVNIRKICVCRDMAPLGIALCRSLSIPSRMVVGYLYGLAPMDLHAWFEVYVGGRWYTFDPTQTNPRGGYVAVGYGRDAADVAVYNQFGPAVYPTTQSVRVERIWRD
ncbi:MAG: transglutaminase family protein [Roseobacter sp.]|jgi:transglutaminase-like putative cysteine protease|nr:transglutaminase family protein [Roseobacter sp.]